MSRQINAASSSSNSTRAFSRVASASTVWTPIQNGNQMKEKFTRAFHLESFNPGYKTTRDFQNMVGKEQQDSKTRFLKDFDQLPADAKFQMNVEIWMDMYLMGNLENPYNFKNEMVSLWNQSHEDSHIHEIYRNKSKKSEKSSYDRFWTEKFDQPKSVGDRSTKLSNHLDNLHVLFDIVHLVDNGQVKLDDVKKEYEFLLKKNGDYAINPLLLILSVFHRKLQCHSSREAPLGDEFVDINGKVFDRNHLECGPGFEDYWKRKNPEYHLMTTKCEHGDKCRWLHNGQKICLQYMIHGQCSHGKRRDPFYDAGYDDGYIDEEVCPYAHLCLVCHVIQRQAQDDYRFGQSTPYRHPCHLVSPGEAKLAVALDTKRKAIHELEYLCYRYKENMRRREKVPEYELEIHAKNVDRCPWRHPELIDTFIAECLCQQGDKYRNDTGKVCERCRIYHLLKKYPNFDPNLSSNVSYDTRSEEEARFVSRFRHSINNIEYIEKYDLALDITKYLEPWEYDKDYSVKYPRGTAPDFYVNAVDYRARLIRNELVIPGLYIANVYRQTENAAFSDPVLTQVSNHARRFCHVTKKLELFMKHINRRPFSSYGSDHETAGKYYKPKDSYNYGSSFLLMKTSFEVLCKLISLVIKMPAYQKYVSFSKKNPLPRHRTEFRGNIEPAAGLWDKKAHVEALRIKKEEQDRIEEERRKEHEELERQRQEKTRKKREAEEAVEIEREKARKDWMNKIEEEKRLREERIQEEKELLRNYVRNGLASSTNKPSFAAIAGMRSNTMNPSRGNSHQTSTSSSRGGGQTVSSSRGGVQTVSSSRGGVQTVSSRRGNSHQTSSSSSQGGGQTVSSSRGSGQTVSSSRGNSQANSAGRGKGKKNAWTRLY